MKACCAAAEATRQEAEREEEAAEAASRDPAGEEEGGETDDLEGYLSPAEDTFSVFSDEHAAAEKPYVQVE